MSNDMSNRKFKRTKAPQPLLRWGIASLVIALLGVALVVYFPASNSPTSNSQELAHQAANAIAEVQPDSESTTRTIDSSEALATASSTLITGIKTPFRGEFEGIYEPSASQQLPDGSLLILEDESARALNIVTLNADGSISENDKQDKRLVKAFKREISDMEGVTLGENGSVYSTTSFSLTKKGNRGPDRELLLRFSIDAGTLVSGETYRDFGDFLRRGDVFENVRRSNGGNAVDLNEINIEALSFDADKRQLLFGFREPLVDGKSMILRMNNPQQVFEGAEPKLSSDISLLDLDGGGIRSLAYDDHLQAYLIANEVKTLSGKWQSRLWLWNGESKQRPQLLDIPAVKTMKNIEAITSVVMGGEVKLMLLSDDGNMNKKKPAHYLILDYGQVVP